MASLKRLNNFWCEGYDPHVIFLPQLTGNGTENTCTARFICCIEEYYGIIIEADIRTVFTADLFLRSDDDSFGNQAFFQTTWCCIFHRHYNLIAYRCISPVRASQYPDAEYFFCTAIVCHIKS